MALRSVENNVETPPAKQRSLLRSATLILPRTGERVKRVVTLRDPEACNGATDLRCPGDAVGGMASRQGLPRSPRAHRHSPGGWRQGNRKMLRYQSERWLGPLLDFARSSTGIGILKCSFAYLLGSMATFIPMLSNFLGAHNDGKHVVATITVYFHPARSMGSMFEAIFLAFVAFIYAAFISFTSMGVSILFDDVLDSLVLGHVVVLIVFCGGGLGFVGWIKQRLNSPLVGVACSLTSLSIITVVTKEGAVQEADFSPHKILQVLKMLIMAVIATSAVNVGIMPVSARRDLRQNLIDMTDSFADMLAMITGGFLKGCEEELEQGRYQTASKKYKQSHKSLTKNFKEAKWEHYVLGTESEHKLELRLVKCIERMAQNIGGLRSAATTQFALLKQSPTGGETPIPPSMYTPTIDAIFSPTQMLEGWVSDPENFATLEAIAEVSDEERLPDGNTTPVSVDEQGPLPTARTPADIFERFIMHLGPSMKSLAYTLKQILDELPCGPAPDYEIAINSQFHTSLVEAVELYSSARKQALALLYRSKDLAASRPAAIEADFEEVAASCGYFSFSLLDFAESIKDYLDILEDLKSQAETPRTWNWLKFWRYKRSPKRNSEASEDTPLLTPSTDNETRPGNPARDAMHFFRNPKERIMQERTWSYRLWIALRFFRRDDIKFAIKVGIGAALFAMPSFVPSWRPMYSHWRGEWGLVSYMLVCSMTVGASNTTGISRAVGTLIGAVCAIIGWTVSGGNVFILAFIGWLMSIWNFYIIVGKGQGPFGRFIMLTYNLSALYAYSLSIRQAENDEDEGGSSPIISEIALHRVVGVMAGCLWGMIVTRFVWPISARKKFREGLSILLLRMGIIWKRDPLATLTEGESPNTYFNLREGLQLQRYLAQLEALCSSASNEYELKGPFQNEGYSRVLKSISRMLDAFHAMNVVIMKDPKASQGESDILRYTVAERADLCARISHLFQVLASSLKLEFPLNDALPNTDHARDRLLAKVFKYRREHDKSPKTSDEDYALLYAYALVTGQLSKEIGLIVDEFEELFGVLDHELLNLR